MPIRCIGIATVGMIMMATAGHAGEKEYNLGNITIHAPWALATPINAPNGAVYFEIHNSSAQNAYTLSGAVSPVATLVQIHRSISENGLMKMQHVRGGLTVPPASSRQLQPHGLHLMLMGLRRPLTEGEQFIVVLEFDDIGHLEIMVPVGPPDHTIKTDTGPMTH